MEQMCIQTVEDYKSFLSELKGRLIQISESIPDKDRPKRAQKVAAELNVSQTTVANYFAGLLSSPETALTIIEKYNEIFQEAKD